jgi:hypothetical protein
MLAALPALSTLNREVRFADRDLWREFFCCAQGKLACLPPRLQDTPRGDCPKRLGSRYRIGIGIAVVVAIGLIWSVAVMSQWVPVTSAEMSLAAVIQPYEAGRHKAAAQ